MLIPVHAERLIDGSNHDPGAHHTVDRSHMPKMSFSKFDGTDPVVWKEKCFEYFHLFKIPKDLWVTSVSLHMEGNAAKWL